MKKFNTAGIALLWLAVVVMFAQAGRAYSVLTHEQVIDLLWTDRIQPILKARFPDLTEKQFREAHAYAYGGSLVQDMGYYPFGSRYFSDLTHYVRTGDFVNLAAPLPDFALNDAGVDGGTLPDGGLVSQQRGVVTRDVFNDPRKDFPLISDGFMVLWDVPRDGGVVNGSFSVTFQRCVDFGCGRTVFGDFKAKVQ